MENSTAFDLNQNVSKWREGLANAGTLRSADLDELEHHLRDSIVQLRARDLSEEEAFFVATGRLGSSHLLSREFAKVNSSPLWQGRLCWMLLGIFLYQVVMQFPNTAVLLRFGDRLPGNGHVLGFFIVAMKWGGLLGAVALLRAISKSHPGWALRFVKRPVLSVLAMVSVSVLLPTVSVVPLVLFGTANSPAHLAHFQVASLWQLWGFTLAQAILLPLVIVYLTRRRLGAGTT